MPQVILPSVFLDNVVLSEPAAIVLMNQLPAEDETGVAKATDIQLDISIPSGDSLATASIEVEGVTAWTLAGGFQTGFSGSTSNPDADTTRVIVNPDTDFVSEQVVDVRVQATATGASAALDETYSFTIIDTTLPTVLSAEARDLDRVRVVFDEAMTSTASPASASALTAANYTLTPLAFPAVTPVVTSVVALGTTTFDISTDIDLSPGIQYRVNVANAADLVGNVIAAPDDDALFIAFVPPAPATRKWDLYKFLPQMNREEDVTQDLFKFIACLQEVTGLLLYDIDRLSDTYDPDISPEPFLSGMLCDLGNPFAFAELTVADKRRLISILVPLYKEKGTCIGIINAIRFFVGVEVTCDEYLADCLILGESELGFDWELCPADAATRYTFSIVSPVALTDEQRSDILQIVDLMKPAHTHLGAIVEPDTSTIDHVELGVSELGATWDLH